MPAPAVTVFTSCYNQGDLLPAAIESVLAQTYGDFELLLYDDGSTDRTWEVMQRYEARDPRIIAHRRPKQPSTGCLVNESLRSARGRFWLWCPSDDRLLPRCIEAKHAASAEWAHAAAIYSHWEVIDAGGRLLRTETPPCYAPAEFRRLIWRDCPIGFVGVWIPLTIFARVGPFPEDEPCSEDYCWLLRAVGRGVDFRCVPEVLCQKRLHDNRTSVRHAADIAARVAAIRQRVLQELADALVP